MPDPYFDDTESDLQHMSPSILALQYTHGHFVTQGPNKLKNEDIMLNFWPCSLFLQEINI